MSRTGPARTVSYEEAERVVAKLSRRFGRHAWMRGVGIMRDPEGQGFAVTFRIAFDGPLPEIRAQIDGVRVVVERREMARALRGATP